MKTHKKRRRIHKTKKHFGSGNFINPKNSRECYTHLSTEKDVESEFNREIIPDTQLFENLTIVRKLGEGGYNSVYIANGINNCKIKSDWSIKSHPLLFRHSKYNITENLINNFKNEMIFQVKLSYERIMPLIYACGIFKSTTDNDILNTNEGDIYTFTIMEKIGTKISEILTDPDKSYLWKKIIQKTLKLYKKMAKAGICNIDVYSDNVVASLSEDGNIERIALIDLDTKFNIEVKNKNLSADLMKAIFLLPLRDNTTNTELLSIINDELKKIHEDSFIKIKQILQDNENLYNLFSNYGILEYFV